MDDELETCNCQPDWKNYLARKLVAIAAIAGAVTLIMTNHNEGWGWLVVLAFLSA